MRTECSLPPKPIQTGLATRILMHLPGTPPRAKGQPPSPQRWQPLPSYFIKQGCLVPASPAHRSPAPGLPLPHGDAQNGSPGLDAFHSAKSVLARFSDVSKLASPSADNSAEPTAHGLSLPYV